MTDREAFIWHDASGQIIAVGHTLDEGDLSVDPVVRDGQSIVRVQLPERLLSELHLTHCVDCQSGEVVKRGQAL